MAFRRPLVLNGSYDFIEMSDAQINVIRDRCRYLYGSNPSVTLSVVGSGGNLGTINDTRKRSGTAHTSVSSYPSEGTTGEPQTVTVGYSRMSESRASVSAPADTNNVAFPIYNDSGNIRAMTLTDVYDTFIYSAIDTLTGSVGQPGIYRIHTGSSLSGYSLVSGTPVFSDTRANTGSYSAGNIGGSGSVQDYAFTVTNFYLLRANNIAAPNMENMLYIRNSDKNIQLYTDAQVDNFLSPSIRRVASEGVGSRIDYTINGSGTTLGSGMTNTILNGSGAHNTRFVNADDYRAQEFPNGSAVTASTSYLRVGQN